MRNKINFRFQRSSEHCKRVAEEIDQVSISFCYKIFIFSHPLELSAALFSYFSSLRILSYPKHTVTNPGILFKR